LAGNNLLQTTHVICSAFLVSVSTHAKLCNIPQRAAVRTYNSFCENCNFKRRLQLRLGRDSTTIPLRYHAFFQRIDMSVYCNDHGRMLRAIHHYHLPCNCRRVLFLGSAHEGLSVCGSTAKMVDPMTSRIDQNVPRSINQFNSRLAARGPNSK